MKINVKAVIAGNASWSEPVQCRIEIRDVSLMDAASELVTYRETILDEASESKPCFVEFDIPDDLLNKRSLEIWGHLSMNRSERILKGDYITTVSYPLKSSDRDSTIMIKLYQV